MIQRRVLYTDGRNVTITETEFQVRRMSYQLQGITKHGMHIIKPFRLPGFVLFVVGVALLVASILNYFPIDLISPVEVWSVMISAKALSIGISAGIVLASILVIGLLHERYAVRIATAEGEKNVVVSQQKEYITQIINALNRALNLDREKQ